MPSATGGCAERPVTWKNIVAARRGRSNYYGRYCGPFCEESSNSADTHNAAGIISDVRRGPGLSRPQAFAVSAIAASGRGGDGVPSNRRRRSCPGSPHLATAASAAPGTLGLEISAGWLRLTPKKPVLLFILAARAQRQPLRPRLLDIGDSALDSAPQHGASVEVAGTLPRRE